MPPRRGVVRLHDSQLFALARAVLAADGRRQVDRILLKLDQAHLELGALGAAGGVAEVRLEDEANFLARAMLVPAKAAWGIAKRRMAFDAAGEQYGCSIQMVRWRVNVTGARRLLAS